MPRFPKLVTTGATTLLGCALVTHVAAQEPTQSIRSSFRDNNPFAFGAKKIEVLQDPFNTPTAPVAFDAEPPTQPPLEAPKTPQRPVNPFTEPSDLRTESTAPSDPPTESAAPPAAPTPSNDLVPVPPSPTPNPETEKTFSPHMPEFQPSKSASFVPWNPAPPTGIELTPAGSNYPTVKINGFFQTDAIFFNQDDANKETVGDVSNGADFRRARLSAQGSVWENVDYMMEMDFAALGRPSFMDVYMDLKEMPAMPGVVRIGLWRQPTGMESLTGVKELPFLERPLLQAFSPFRQIGIGLIDPDQEDNTTWAVSVARFPTDFYGDNYGDSGGYSFVTRETVVLGGRSENEGLIHFGVDYSYLNSSLNRFRYFSQPEVAFNDVPNQFTPEDPPNVPPFVDTGWTDARHANLFGGEMGTRAGSLWTQAEAYLITLDQFVGPNPTYWGAYAQVGYILTGEVRPYNRAGGVFGRVAPSRPLKRGAGLGAWEVAGRLSTIDLTDGTVVGGRETNLTAGLNWYLNTRTKFQFNYIHVNLDQNPVGNSDADIVAARVQVDF